MTTHTANYKVLYESGEQLIDFYKTRYFELKEKVEELEKINARKLLTELHELAEKHEHDADDMAKLIPDTERHEGEAAAYFVMGQEILARIYDLPHEE